MRLNEIALISHGKDWAFYQLAKEWKSDSKSIDPKIGLGKIAAFRIDSLRTSNKVILYRLFDTVNDVPAGFVQLVKQSQSYTPHSALSPKYQGIGLGLKLYIWFILHQNLTLRSDQKQSEGSKKLWEKLAKDTRISVYQYNIATGNAYAIDPDDFDAVYDKEIQKEINLVSLQLRGTKDESKKRKLYARLQDLKMQLHDMAFTTVLIAHKK
jgi:hypothetical protein